MEEAEVKFVLFPNRHSFLRDEELVKDLQRW